MTSNAGANESARTTDQGPFSPRHYSIRIPSAQEPPNEGTNQRCYVLRMMMLDVGRGLPSGKNMTVAASTMGTMMNSPKMNPHACSSIPCVHVERDSRIASLPTPFGPAVTHHAVASPRLANLQTSTLPSQILPGRPNTPRQSGEQGEQTSAWNHGYPSSCQRQASQPHRHFTLVLAIHEEGDQA